VAPEPSRLHFSVAPEPSRLHFSVAPEPSRLLRARERIRDYLMLHCTDEAAVDDVVLAIEEACTNAIQHSGSDEAIDVVVALGTDGLEITVKDSGRGFDVAAFDPDRVPDPLLDHGRGLFLMARLCDAMRLRGDAGLEVHLHKRLVPQGQLPPVFERGLVPGAEAAARTGRRRAMLDEIGEGFEAFDWEYRYVHMNELALRRVGRSLDELLGRTPWEVFPALEGSDLAQAFREAMELGRPAVLEHRSVVDDQWLEARVNPTSVGISCYYRGIDERKRTEESLERTRRRTELLQWVAASLLASNDPQGLVEELCRRVMAELDCQAFFNLLVDGDDGRLRPNAWAGVSDDEALRIQWLDHVCGRAARAGERMVAEDITPATDPRTGRDLSLGFTACAAHPLKVQDSVIGTLSFATRTHTRFSDEDLDLMKAVADHVAMAVHHQQAEAGRRRYEMLAANSRDIILFMERDGRIIEANQAAEDAYGYSRRELLGMNVADLRAAATRTTIAAQMTEADERGILFESLHRRKDGSVFSVEVSSQDATVGGRRTLVSVVRDVSERKCAEEALQESERRQRFALQHAPAAIYEIDLRPPRSPFRQRQRLHVHVQRLLARGAARHEPVRLARRGGAGAVPPTHRRLPGRRGDAPGGRVPLPHQAW
jgi:PAS domain S-box-containing protein